MMYDLTHMDKMTYSEFLGFVRKKLSKIEMIWHDHNMPIKGRCAEMYVSIRINIKDLKGENDG